MRRAEVKELANAFYVLIGQQKNPNMPAQRVTHRMLQNMYM
jgi:hypothetical protein